MQERLLFIDWMKALGMLFIIIGHFSPPLFTNYNIFIQCTIFFFISGFLFRREENLNQFACKCFRTLLIPFYIWGGLMLVFYNLQQRSMDIFFYSLEGLFLGCNNFMGVRGCGELWFIVTLLWLKIIMQFNKRDYMTWILVLLSILCAVAYKYLISNTQIAYWGVGVFNSFVAYPFFAIGQSLSKYKDGIKKIASRIDKYPFVIFISILAFIAITVVLIAPMNGIVHMVYGGYGNNILLYLIIGIIGIIYMFFIAIFLSKIKSWYKCVRYVNTGSIMVLGIHIGFVNKIRPYLVSIFGNEGFGFELSIISASVLLLLIFIPMIKFFTTYFPITLGYRN